MVTIWLFEVHDSVIILEEVYFVYCLEWLNSQLFNNSFDFFVIIHLHESKGTAFLWTTLTFRRWEPLPPVLASPTLFLRAAMFLAIYYGERSIIDFNISKYSIIHSHLVFKLASNSTVTYLPLNFPRQLLEMPTSNKLLLSNKLYHLPQFSTFYCKVGSFTDKPELGVVLLAYYVRGAAGTLFKLDLRHECCRFTARFGEI